IARPVSGFGSGWVRRHSGRTTALANRSAVASQRCYLVHCSLSIGQLLCSKLKANGGASHLNEKMMTRRRKKRAREAMEATEQQKQIPKYRGIAEASPHIEELAKTFSEVAIIVRRKNMKNIPQ